MRSRIGESLIAAGLVDEGKLVGKQQHLREPHHRPVDEMRIARVALEREALLELLARLLELPLVRQLAYIVARPHKPAALGRLLDVEAPEAALVFCRTREEVDSLTETLNGRGYRAEALHGGLSQEQREVFLMREFLDMPFKQIADVVGVPENTTLCTLFPTG